MDKENISVSESGTGSCQILEVWEDMIRTVKGEDVFYLLIRNFLISKTCTVTRTSLPDTGYP